MTSDVQDLEEAAGEPRLRRSIGTTQLALYALGSMVGSGIYGLIGKAAGQAGTAVWLSFIVALFAALLTSLSYASLGSRYPRAGGAAYVTERAFGTRFAPTASQSNFRCSGIVPQQPPTMLTPNSSTKPIPLA